MEFEVLKKSHLKRNIIIGVLVVGIISAIVLNFTRAKYRVTQSIPLVNGTINYSPYDLKLVAMYQQNDSGEYESIDTVPESGYQLNEEQSYCEVNGEEDASISVSYNTDTRSLSISSMTTKGTKCYLYFDEQKPLLGETILANATSQLTRTDFSTTVTDTTIGIIYYADTSKGRTYYFAGNPTDNWIRFGGFYWRIIRINEDGTIRLIYQGTSANTTGTITQIGTSVFNNPSQDNMYVGYMYESNQVHGLTSNSTIKGVLDQWYQDNLTEVSDKIDGNAGFCGDRAPSTSYSVNNGSGGTGTTETYYGAHFRVGKNEEPKFECTNESDLYTVDGSSKGNGKLTYPIGLISADEVAYAGGVYNTSNSGYYLYTNQYYWTMSPYYYSPTFGAVMYTMRPDGKIHYDFAYIERSVRPVINLRADVTISSGNGSSSDPFVVM